MDTNLALKTREHLTAHHGDLSGRPNIGQIQTVGQIVVTLGRTFTSNVGYVLRHLISLG
jgi:hypothetical protein